MEWAQTKEYELEKIFRAASWVGTDEQPRFRRGLSNPNPAIRYWSAVGLGATSHLSVESAEALALSLDDRAACVRIESAGVLVRHGVDSRALGVLGELLKGDDTTVLLHAGRTVELLGEKAISLHDDMNQLFKRFEDDPADAAWFIRFTTTGFLNRVR